MGERSALYLIGEPGIGKSTLAEGLTRGLGYEEAEQPFAHRRYDCGPLEIGKRRDSFSGTDALAMNVQPAVEQFVRGVHPKLLFAEGDRLASSKFFTWLTVTCGYDLVMIWLYGPTLAAQRRAARVAALGSKPQNETWLLGRQTKVRVLGESWKAIKMDATLPPEMLVRLVPGAVAEAFKAGRVAVGAG